MNPERKTPSRVRLVNSINLINSIDAHLNGLSFPKPLRQPTRWRLTQNIGLNGLSVPKPLQENYLAGGEIGKGLNGLSFPKPLQFCVYSGLIPSRLNGLSVPKPLQ